MGFRDVVSFLFEDPGQTITPSVPVHVQQPVTASSQPGTTVWVLVIMGAYRNVDDVFTCSSGEMANLALDSYVDHWWTHCGLEWPPPKDFAEKVAAFFEHSEGECDYEIFDMQIDDLSNLIHPEPQRMRF